MNKTILAILSFVGGAVVGVLATKHIWEKKASEQIEAMEEFYKTRDRYFGEKNFDEVPAEKIERPDNATIPVDYTKFSKSDKPSLDQFVAEHPIAVDEPPEEAEETATILTAEEFENSSFEKVSLLYYYEDDLMVEELGDSVMIDFEDILGDTINSFAPDMSVFYVRCNRLEIDYEIHRAEGSFMNGES